MSLTDAIRLFHAATLKPARRRSDAELLRLFNAERDEAAFRELVERYEGVVRGICQRWVRDSHAIDDAVQATFLTLACKAHSIRHPEALPAWLYRVARSITSRIRPSSPLEIEPFDTAPSPLDQLSAREILSIFDEELGRLPDHYRTAILLCTLDGLTLDEAAQRLQTTEGSIRGWLQRGREQLRKRLQRRGIELAVVMPLLWQATSRSEAGLRDQIAQCALGSQPATVAVTKLMGSSSLLPATMVGGVTACVLATVLLLSTQQKHEEPKHPPAVEVAKVEQAETDQLPEGAIARIGSPRLRHAGEVVAVAISDDNRWLASASTDSQDKSVRVWDLSNGKEKYRFPIEMYSEHNRNAIGLGFSQDSKTLLLIDCLAIRSFDLQTGKVGFNQSFFSEEEISDKKLIKYPREIIGASISPDRKVYAIVRVDGEMTLGDTSSGKIKKSIANSFHKSPNVIYSSLPIIFTPDSAEVCMPIKADSIPIFDISSGESKRNISSELINDFNTLLQCCFLPDSKKLITLTCEINVFNRQRNHIMIGDVATGKMIQEIPCKLYPYRLAVSPNGKIVAVGILSHHVLLVDPKTGRQLQEIPLMGIPSRMVFSPDSKLIAITASESESVILWNVEKNAIHPHSADLSQRAHFDRQGNIVHRHSASNGTPIYRTLDWRKGKVLVEKEVDLVGPSNLTIDSPDNKLQAVIETKNQHTPQETCKYLIRDKSTHQVIARFEEEIKSPASTLFADDNRLLIGVTRDTLYVWNIASQKLLWSEVYKQPMQSVHMSLPKLDSKNQRIAIGAFTNNTSLIEVWDIRSKKKATRIEIPKLLHGYDFAFSPDGKFVAAGNEEIVCWRVADGREIYRINGASGSSSPIEYPYSLCEFSADNRKLMTVDQTGTIRVWEFATGKLIRTFTGHHGETSAHFSPDSRYIVGSSGDAPIYIWDVYGTKAKTPFDGESLWKTLADQNAEKAFMAVRELIASPKEALALLKAKLPPDLLDQKVIDQHLIDLGSPRFAVREKASAALLKIGESIEPQLKKALQTTTDEEVRQRLTAILEALNAPSSEKLRTLRALDALEHLGTPEARQYLEILSKGSPPGLRTQLAKEALERLAGQ